MLLAAYDHPELTESFEGFCYAGSDYIAGQSGFNEYRARGLDVPPGRDGCYTVFRRIGGVFEAGTDARGLRRLFLFRRGRMWALSSSLYGLVQHLRSSGVQVRPNRALLAPLSVRASLTTQSSTTQTFFEDVQLIPSFCVVRFPRGFPRVEALPAPEPADDYTSTLRHYLTTWVSRFATLADQSRTDFTLDLSGGLDSRVVMAFALASGRLTSDPHKFRVVSQERMPEDFCAASRIADQHAIALNGPALPLRSSATVDTALRMWRENNLGVYLPVYLSTHTFDPFSIRGHGSGGGLLRGVHEGVSMSSRLESIRPRLEDDVFEEWSSTVTQDLERLAAMRPALSTQNLHYREFRNRFHFGHAQHQRGTFSPLNSMLLDPLSVDLGSGGRHTFYDAMDCLVPGLKNFPYDTPKKGPERSEPSAEAQAVGPIDVEPGEVFGDMEPSGGKPGNARQVFNALYDQADRALKNSSVRDLLKDPQVEKRAKRFLKEVRSSTSRPRANHAGFQDISYLLTVAFAAGELEELSA